MSDAEKIARDYLRPENEFTGPNGVALARALLVAVEALENIEFEAGHVGFSSSKEAANALSAIRGEEKATK